MPIIAVDWGLDPQYTARLEPATIENVNDLTGRDVVTIDDGSVDDGVAWALGEVPSELSGATSAVLVALIATPAATGNFRFIAPYRSIKTTATGESADPSTWQTTPTSGNIAVPGTARLLKRYTAALTIADLSSTDKDFLQGEFLRELSNAGDTVGDVAVIHALFIDYTP